MATPIPGKFRIDDDGNRVPVYAVEAAQTDDACPSGVVSGGDANFAASEETPVTTPARPAGKSKRGGNK